MNCIRSLSFFKDLFTHVHDFWSHIGVLILGTPKQEVERKSLRFYGVKFFHSNFKVEWENGVRTKIRFLASGFFCSHAAISLWFLLFFLDQIFLNGFYNPFIVHSRPSFLFEPNFHLSLVVFIWFFSKWFLSDFFFEVIYSIRFLSVLGLVCCLVDENFLNCTLGRPAMFFYFVVRIFVNTLDLPLKNYFLTLKLTFIYFNSKR